MDNRHEKDRRLEQKIEDLLKHMGSGAIDSMEPDLDVLLKDGSGDIDLLLEGDAEAALEESLEDDEDSNVYNDKKI